MAEGLRKRPDYTHRPRGAYVWLGTLAVVFAYEMFGAFRDVEHTLSRTVWWVLGPEYGTRWWLLGLPLWALLLWTGPHFLWPHWFTPIVLLWMLAAAFLLAAAVTVLR